jgi:hypothetical protein
MALEAHDLRRHRAAFFPDLMCFGHAEHDVSSRLAVAHSDVAHHHQASTQ